MSDQLPEPGTWTIDSVHSFTAFTVEHFTVAFAHGIAAGPTGTITIADDVLSSSVTASVDVTTLTTANQMRDEKILGPDVLDAGNHPTIDFVSRTLLKAAEGYELDGNLTLHGITRPVTLALTPHGVITDTWGKTRFGLTATTEIQRSEFDVLKFGYVALASGGFMVPDAVRVTLEIEATRDEAAGLQAVQDLAAGRAQGLELGGGQGVHDELADGLDMAGGGFGDLVPAGAGENRVDIAAVPRAGLTADPAAPLQPADHVRQAGQRPAGHGGQVAHAQCAVRGLGQADQDHVLEVRDVRVPLQLGVEGGGEPEQQRRQRTPGLLLVLGQPAGLVHRISVAGPPKPPA